MKIGVQHVTPSAPEGTQTAPEGTQAALETPKRNVDGRESLIVTNQSSF